MIDRSKKIFVILVSVSLWGLGGNAAEPQIDRRVAKKIAKEKGVLNPKEVLEWKMDSKDIPKDWIKLDNRYFSVSYPKCFNIEGEEGEDDPKIAPSILFRRSKNCPGFVKEYGDSNSFNIGLIPMDFKSVDHAFLENTLSRQSINLNGIQAVALVGLMDHYDEVRDKFEYQSRWQVFTICKGKTFQLGFDLPPGKHSESLVEKNNYDFPDDFKKIVSTFKCK